ncbi:MAG: type II toxin-antitoxin system VapC family toxin [Terracidiphilus sp.]|jgi:predicted nucleic acid-binding protein
MIILDTNVISEPMRAQADPAVAAWLDRQETGTLYLTATNLSEVLVGIEMLPEGRRKQGMGAAMHELLELLFEERFLEFDREAAAAYSVLISRALAKGVTISVADGQIAALAAVHGFTVATRDAAPFLAAGVAVINPWVS